MCTGRFFVLMEVEVGFSMSSAQFPARGQNKSIWFKCPYANQCGACQLLKFPYQVQLCKKQEYVESLLSEFCNVDRIIGMENPFHYRNKAHAVLSQDRSGCPVSGVYAEGTHHVVPVRHCLIESEAADRIIQSIVQLLPSFSWRIYNEHTHKGLLRHVVVRTSNATGQIMVTLVATSADFPDQERFVDLLLSSHPEITTVVLNINPRITSAVLGTKEKVLHGPGYIEDILCGKRFRISSRSFYQVNARQTEILYQTAIRQCRLSGCETLLDAYCGTGTIGICASDHVKRILGVEVNSQAIADARINATINGISNTTFYTDDAGRFMTRLSAQKISPDVVIMDPPRAGSSKPFLDALLALHPNRIVYVSCNPQTLQRDLHMLVNDDYLVQAISPVDMFPGTQHVECVVLMSRVKK